MIFRCIRAVVFLSIVFIDMLDRIIELSLNVMESTMPFTTSGLSTYTALLRDFERIERDMVDTQKEMC
jgi:hypothetical protein